MSVAVRDLWLGLYAISWREIAKFLRQTERLLSALVRPALWLLVFATGLHDLLGVSIIPPYQTYPLPGIHPARPDRHRGAVPVHAVGAVDGL